MFSPFFAEKILKSCVSLKYKHSTKHLSHFVLNTQGTDIKQILNIKTNMARGFEKYSTDQTGQCHWLTTWPESKLRPM